MRPEHINDPYTKLDRRALLAGLVLGCCGLATKGRGQDQDSALPPELSEEEEEREILARAEQLDLGTFQTVRNDYYLGIGNAPEDFLNAALSLCEGLAKDYLNHFPARGFAVEAPARRLTVVALSNAESLAKFLGLQAQAAASGIYDLDSNRLVVFDNRDTGRADIRAERSNTISLFHEATHQLTFNTGLLNRFGDVPLLISEGLATYGEVRRPDGRTRIGQLNAERFQVLIDAMEQNAQFFPIAELLAQDPLFDQAGTEQLAYAQGWLFVHAFLSTRSSATRFRNYLESLHDRRDSSTRLEDARTHLGDLNQIDRNLLAYATRLTRR